MEKYAFKIFGDKKMKPRIFLSSTFYDLKYIREDLSRFIMGKNYEPILSERGNIGYTPGKPLDLSCYEAIHQSDMTILLIGGRYGSAASGETIEDCFSNYLSVTRKEFRTAVENGIPLFAFIDKNVYTEFELYEKNENLFAEKAENQTAFSFEFIYTEHRNVFRFIHELKTSVGLPIFCFSSVNDIKKILDEQWADMMKKYLTALREKKTIDSLNTTVQEINHVMQKLESQVSVMGSKIYDSKSEFEEKTSIMQAYHAIKQSVHLFNPVHNAQRKIYDADIRHCIDAFTKSINVIRQRQAVEDDFDFQECSKIIIACLNEYALKLSSLTSTFLQNLDVLFDVLNREESKEKVVAMFLQKPEDLITL